VKKHEDKKKNLVHATYNGEEADSASELV